MSLAKKKVQIDKYDMLDEQTKYAYEGTMDEL